MFWVVFLGIYVPVFSDATLSKIGEPVRFILLKFRGISNPSTMSSKEDSSGTSGSLVPVQEVATPGPEGVLYGSFQALRKALGILYMGAHYDGI